MESLNSKFDIIESLMKREQERQLEVKKRKEDKSHHNAENEKIGVFQKIYNEERHRIEKTLDTSSCIPVDTLPEHFDNIYKNILQLQKYVAASNVFLRVYDIQKSNKELQELLNKTRELEEKFIPKKKFGFKNKKQHQKLTAINANGVSRDETDFVKKETSQILHPTPCDLSNKNGEHLTLSNTDIFKQDVNANNLTNCVVCFYGNPSTLHLSNLKNCVILSGPVSTSVFTENCEDCTLVVACQQLRLHSSKNIKIYLHVTSKGILEDCSDIAVAPYNFSYDTIDDDYKASGLDLTTNHWDHLDDFNWLNVAHHSPNWHVLDEKDRVKTWYELLKT